MRVDVQAHDVCQPELSQIQKYAHIYLMWRSTCKNLNRGDTLRLNDTCASTLFSPSSPRLISALRTAQHFLSLLLPSSPPFSLFSAPLKLCLAVLPSLSLSLSVPHSFTLSPSISRSYTFLHAHTHRLSICSVPLRKMLSFHSSPIQIKCPQWAISYPSISPSPSLLPFSAFGITILSESFIYPFSSFIPLPIISASLPSMTHSPIRPILLPALFLHHRCLFRQPISPSSVLLPSISSLISFCHH